MPRTKKRRPPTWSWCWLISTLAARVALVGQDQAGEHLDLRPVGLHPHAGGQLLAHGGLAGGVEVVDVAPLVGGQLDVLGELAGVRVLVANLVGEFAEGGVGRAA